MAIKSFSGQLDFLRASGYLCSSHSRHSKALNRTGFAPNLSLLIFSEFTPLIALCRKFRGEMVVHFSPSSEATLDVYIQG